MRVRHSVIVTATLLITSTAGFVMGVHDAKLSRTRAIALEPKLHEESGILLESIRRRAETHLKLLKDPQIEPSRADAITDKLEEIRAEARTANADLGRLDWLMTHVSNFWASLLADRKLTPPVARQIEKYDMEVQHKRDAYCRTADSHNLLLAHPFARFIKTEKPKDAPIFPAEALFFKSHPQPRD